MNGILLIDKPMGWTSSDVVAKLRGVLHEKRIGHSGTLDPMATGLLVLFVGRATRAVEFAESHDKRYLARLRLGLATDTQDTTGTPVGGTPRPVSREELEAALSRFRGEIEQIPPMYSAIKVKGRKLYQYARDGREVERTARRVTIDGIEVEAVRPPFAWFTVECSKGTYVRTLCHDIGEKLGCGGAMDSLCRVQSGSFRLEDSVKIDEVRDLLAEGRLEEKLIGLERLLKDYPVFVCDEAHEKALLNGNRLDPEWGSGTAVPEGPIAVKDSGGRIKALYRFDEEDKMLHPDVMLL
jgi:tRNA pseudouridine 55 synthase